MCEKQTLDFIDTVAFFLQTNCYDINMDFIDHLESVIKLIFELKFLGS
jgi:hypothetical protein